jgi:hypothetical protein
VLAAARRPAALLLAGFLAGCVAVLSYNAATGSSSGQVTPLTKQQQLEQLKSQFPDQ